MEQHREPRDKPMQIESTDFLKRDTKEMTAVSANGTRMIRHLYAN